MLSTKRLFALFSRTPVYAGSTSRHFVVPIRQFDAFVYGRFCFWLFIALGLTLYSLSFPILIAALGLWLVVGLSDYLHFKCVNKIRFLGFDGDFYIILSNRARINLRLLRCPLVLSGAVLVSFREEKAGAFSSLSLWLTDVSIAQPDLHVLQRFFMRPERAQQA